MAIDITNKEEKQIALTGAEIEETLLQAHLSKDAIAKIEGLEASASEVNGSVAKTLGYVTPEMFGATGSYNILVDDTPFVTAALATGKTVILNGSYTLNGLRLQSGSQLIGLGFNKTTVYQMNANTPAINCTSDNTVGQLLGINVSNFQIVGYGATATSSALLVAAYGAYVVHNCSFDLYITKSYHALEVQGLEINNIYKCFFKIVSNRTYHDAILLNGGVYNVFDLFLTECMTKALGGGTTKTYSMQTEGEYTIICDGHIYVSDQSSIFIKPTVEGLLYTSSAGYMFSDKGFNNNWVQPRAICLTQEEADKVSSGCVFKAFSNTIIDNPRFNVSSLIANPFGTDSASYTFTIIGSGQNACTNKLEVLWDGSDRSKNIDNITLIGDVSQFTSKYSKKNKEVLVFKEPSNDLNLQLQRYDSLVIIAPTIPTLQALSISWKVPDNTTLKDGHSVKFYISTPVTAISWSGSIPLSVDKTLLPTSTATSTTFTIVYSETNNKWYKI